MTTAIGLDKLPADGCVMRLAKHVRDELILCEPVIFNNGASAVNTILRRAAISGRVEVEGDISDYFADVMNADADTILATVSLDRKSYAILKNKWMRCRIERPLRERAAELGLK